MKMWDIKTKVWIFESLVKSSFQRAMKDISDLKMGNIYRLLGGQTVGAFVTRPRLVFVKVLGAFSDLNLSGSFQRSSERSFRDESGGPAGLLPCNQPPRCSSITH